MLKIWGRRNSNNVQKVLWLCEEIGLGYEHEDAGGEFGRTIYCQGGLTKTNYGRDHHPRCYTKWMAGAGIQGGIVYGETDDFSYNVIENPVHIHDLNATILDQLGVNHERLTFRHQGRDFRLTDVHGKVVREILA